MLMMPNDGQPEEEQVRMDSERRTSKEIAIESVDHQSLATRGHLARSRLH